MTNAQLVAVMHRRRARRLARATHPQPLPPIIHPSDVAYRVELQEVARRTQRLIVERIVPVVVQLANARTDADESPAAQLKRLFEKIRFLIPERTTASAQAIAQRMVKDTNRANAAALNVQFRGLAPQLAKIDVFAEGSESVAPRLRQAVRRNVELIESIPLQLLDDVKDVVLPAIEQGTRVEAIQAQIQERFGVSDRRASLIARDQVGKLNGELSQTRQESVGVESYTWWTVLDERVRSMHEPLHGLTFLWSDPPVVALNPERHEHPGGDFSCRCQARPNVEDLLASLGIADDDATPTAVSVPEALQPAPTPAEEHTRRVFAADIVNPQRVLSAQAEQVKLDLGAQAEAIFGRQLDAADADALAGGAEDLPAGHDVKVNLVERQKKNVKFVQLIGGITNAEGSPVGTFVRQFTRTASGEVEAFHGQLFIQESAQNQGLGRALFNAQLEAYKQLGVGRVALDASEVGRYVWSKAGFNWTDPAQFTRIRDELKAQLAEKFGDARASAITRSLQTPRDIALLTVDGEQVGKNFLVNLDEHEIIRMSQATDEIQPL